MNFDFVQMKKEFLNFYKFAKLIAYNEKYSRPSTAFDYVDKEQEYYFLKDNISNENDFLIFLGFKIYSYFKLYFKIHIKKFICEFVVQKNNFLFDPYLIDIKIFDEDQVLKYNFEKLAELKKQNTLKENLNLLEKENEQKFQKTLNQYIYKFANKNVGLFKKNKLVVDQNIQKMYGKTYNIVFEKLKKGEDFNFKSKLDFELYRYFDNRNKKRYSDSKLLKTTCFQNQKNSWHYLKEFFDQKNVKT